MEKPNLERIAEVFKLDLVKHAFKEDTGDTFSADVTHFETIWRRIIEYNEVKEEVDESEAFVARHYYYPEVESLRSLCKEYNVISSYPDLRFLAFKLGRKLFTLNLHKHQRQGTFTFHENNIELLSALSVLNKHKNGISIKLFRNQKDCGHLRNPEVVKVVFSALMEYFLKNNPILYVGSGNEEPPFKDRTEFIDFKLKEESASIKEFKGYEKDKAFLTKNAVFNLWTYLQKYTPIKANEGSEYSNEQARFIFSFLEMFGFIDKEKNISRTEDVIGYYLKSYKKTKPIRYITRKTKE